MLGLNTFRNPINKGVLRTVSVTPDEIYRQWVTTKGTSPQLIKTFSKNSLRSPRRDESAWSHDWNDFTSINIRNQKRSNTFRSRHPWIKATLHKVKKQRTTRHKTSGHARLVFQRWFPTMTVNFSSQAPTSRGEGGGGRGRGSCRREAASEHVCSCVPVRDDKQSSWRVPTVQDGSRCPINAGGRT